MNELLNNIMLNTHNVIDETFYSLPDILDMTYENPIINFDKGKQDSYLFYVEAPFQEHIGYYPDVKAFVIKANPYIKKFDLETGTRYNELNITDGDTMYFILDSIVDTNTAFSIGERTYTSFKSFLTANEQTKLIVRLLGLDTPELIKYQEVPIDVNKIGEYLIQETFANATNKPDVYILESLDYAPNQTLTFLKSSTTFNQVVSETPTDDPNIKLYRFVSSNSTLGKSADYLHEAVACQAMLEDLLTRATDIRLVLDQQSLNRKPSDYSTPYDRYEVLTTEGMFTSFFALIDALWQDYYGYLKYPHRSYNAPGLDTYGRSLGEIYVKLYVPELQTETWVNAAKYILFHQTKHTVAVPAYSSNPTDVYHNNFMSPVFKLNTYDKRYKDIIDGFTHATGELIDERDQWYSQITGMTIEHIKEYSVILGDTVLTVPPMNIRSVTETSHTKIPLLRAKGAIVKSLPTSQKMIELDLYFNDDAGINGTPCQFTGKNGTVHTYYMNGLRSLIAQFKLTPFLPIESHYINNDLLIDAVTLVNINVQTMTNYPKCLKATLTLAEFNYAIFMPELPGSDVYNAFSQSIHYPAMRWYYQKLLVAGESIKYLDFNSQAFIEKAYGSNTALVPMHFKDSKLAFYMPDHSQLTTRLEILSDTRPVLTQEQLTEEMLVGAKKLKPLIENIRQLPQNDSFVDSVQALIDTVYFNPVQMLYASPNLTDIATNMTYHVPLYSVLSHLGSPELIQHTLMRTFFIKRQDGLLIYPNTIPEPVRQQIATIHTTRLNQFLAEAQQALGLFGAVEATVHLADEQLIIELYMPLPHEIVQSSYELQLIAKKVYSSLGIDNVSDYELFKTTENGQISIALPIVLGAQKIESDRDLLYQAIPASSHAVFTLDFHDIGLRALDYLYAISSDEINSALGDAVEQELIEQKRDTVLNTAMGLDFVQYDIGDVIVEQIALNYGNTFSNMTLNMVDGKAFQYCGGQDIQIQIALITGSEHTVQALTALPELSADYARLYRRVLNCWPLRINCELTKLFGVLEVLIENVQTETIPNQPGYTRLTLTLSSVDRTVRQREALSRIDMEAENAGYINYGNKGHLDVKTYFDLKHSLAQAELYPDLELPTVDELHAAGFELYRNKSYDQNKAPRTFVDPDFYFIYGHALACEIFRDNFLNAFGQEFAYNLTDKEGAHTVYRKQEEMGEDAKTFLKETQTIANHIAQLQQSFYQNVRESTIQYDYSDMSKEVFKALNDVDKNRFKLAQTLAQLGTSFWHMGEDAKIAFAESTIDLMPETITASYLDIKQELIDAIDTFLSASIEENAPNHYHQTVTRTSDQREAFYSVCSDVIHNLTSQPVFAKISLLSGARYANTQTASLFQTFKTMLTGVICAYADTYSAQSYYTNQILGADTTNWQATQFLTFNDVQKIPFARVEREGQVYASSAEEALLHGVSFGPFNIALREASTLTAIHAPYKSRLETDKRYFLDPYYLEMQLRDDTAGIETHKANLLNLTGYGAIALVREFLYLYRHFLKHDKLLSLYEITRKEAVDVYSTLSQQLQDAGQAWHADYAHGGSEIAIQNEQDVILNDYVMVLKGLSYANLSSDGERQLIVASLGLTEDSIITMALTDMDGTLFDFFSVIKNDRAKSMETLIAHFEAAKLEAQTQNASEEKITRYNYLLEICKNHEAVEVLDFAQEMLQLMEAFNYDNSFNQTHEAMTIKQIFEDEKKLFVGRFIGMAITLLEPQTIMPLINAKKADELTMLITNIGTPSIYHDLSRLRKFLYALEGRDVLSLSTLGKIPHTIEAEYYNYATEKVIIERTNTPELYLRDSFYDMIKHDKRGRMLRAFPTYYMFFIDEGREIGLWKLHDNFYSSTAIAEIEVVKSRKIAADTAHVVLSNLFNSYTQDDRDFIYDMDNPLYEKSMRYKVQDAFNALFSPRTYFNQEELRRQNTPEPLTARLMPGTRMHIRMGYGANASELPIVFNGQITEISNGSVCEIIAQGDGTELLNPILDMQDSSDIQYQENMGNKTVTINLYKSIQMYRNNRFY